MYYMPTKIISSENCVLENSAELALGKKALIVTGRTSAEKCGALADVRSALDREGVKYEVYAEIENNPTVECAFAAGEAAKSAGADFIVAIGGGSPLDAAKAAAVYAVNDIEPMKIFDGGFKNKTLPIAAVPTTAGTGSEVTPYSILTLTDAGTKRNFTCYDCFPKTAFLDGRYTANLPLQVTRNTAVDAMCHAIESAVSKRSTVLSEYIALETLRLIGSCTDALETGAFTPSDRQTLLNAATLGGIAISQTGTTIVHSMGYQPTFTKNVPHGMSNGLLMGAFLKWCYDCAQKTVDKCMDALGMESVDAFSDYLSRILPCEARFTAEDIESYLEISMKAKLASCPKTVTADDERAIYTKSLIR